MMRERPYPEYVPSGVPWPATKPAHWRTERISFLASATSGGTPDRENRAYWDGDIPWVSPKDMKSFEIEDSIEHVTQAAVDETGLKVIEPPAVLVVVRGMILAHSFPVGVTTVPVTINQDMKALQLREDVDPRFFAYYLEGTKQTTFSLIEQAGHGTCRVPWEAWQTTTNTVPPENDQKAVVAYLDYKMALMKSLLMGSEALADRLDAEHSHQVTTLLEAGIAQGRHKPLKRSVPEVTVGIVVNPSHYYQPSGVPCLRSLNISAGHVDLSDLVYISPEANEAHRKSRIYEGDIVMVRTGKAGMAVVVPPSLDGANCIDLLIVRRSPNFIPEWLCNFLNSSAARRQVEALSVGAIQGHFNTRMLSSLQVPVPPLEVQRRTVGQLASVLEARTRLREANSGLAKKLTELRSALITAAVTGQIDVRDHAP